MFHVLRKHETLGFPVRLEALGNASQKNEVPITISQETIRISHVALGYADKTMSKGAYKSSTMTTYANA